MSHPPRYRAAFRSALLLVLLTLLGLPARAQRQFEFLATADCQFFNHREHLGDNPPPYYWITPYQTMHHAMIRLQTEPNLRGLIVAGDLTQGARAEEFAMYIASLGITQSSRVYDGLGNHDYDAGEPDNCTLYPRNCDVSEDLFTWITRPRETPFASHGAPHYSWDWEDVHFVQLNLFPGNDVTYELNPYASLEFLKADLEAHVGSSGRPVVLIHHYGFDSFSQSWWYEWQREAYWEVLAPYNVIAVFTGHLHGPNEGHAQVLWRPASVTWTNRQIPDFISGSARADEDGHGGVNYWQLYLDVAVNGDDMTVTQRKVDGDTSSHATGTWDVNFRSRVVRVTNTNDSGPGSLRWALAGDYTEPRTIEFELDPGDLAWIAPQNQLPTITSPVKIDGLSLPGSSCNAPKVQLDGLHTSGADGLTFGPGSEGSTVRGLAVVNFGGAGIRVGADDVTISCSNVGLDHTGVDAYPNGTGIVLAGSHNVVGGAAADDRNLISGNAGAGVLIESGSTNTVASNWIGMGIDHSDRGNGGDGVKIVAPSSGNLIGSLLASPAQNVIAFNGGSGVVISGSSDNVIAANLIGVTGVGPGGNALHGVQVLAGGDRNVIGLAGAGNTISSNGLWGVLVQDAGTDRTRISANYVGLSLDGVSARGNGEAGIGVFAGATNTIIGTDLDGLDDAAEGNTIATNDREGDTIGPSNANVQVLDAATTGTRIRGNRIGTRANGNALPSGVSSGGVRGIYVTAPGVVVGGFQPEARNVIGGHLHTGIEAVGADATGLVVQNNRVGVGADGTTALGNQTAGVQLYFGPTGATVGTDGDGANDDAEGNLVAHNGKGVVVVSPGTTGNRIRRNAIRDNGGEDGLGIDLGDDGVTADDPGDGDEGPNHLMNRPFNGGGNYDPGTDTFAITYAVDTAPTSATYPLTVDVYQADADNTEGAVWLGRVSYPASAAQQTRTDTFIPAAPPTGTCCIVLTATDAGGGPLGNTSEFSDPASFSVGPPPAPVAAAIEITNPPPPVTLPPSGGTIRFRATLTNTTAQPQTVEAWTDALLPSGAPHGPIQGPVTLTLGANQTYGPVSLRLRVPHAAPAGSYTVRLRVGDYPDAVDSEASFTFTKAAALAGRGAEAAGDEGFTLEGDGLDAFLAFVPEAAALDEAGAEDAAAVEAAEPAASEALPETFALHAAVPNPFSDRVVLRYDLPETSHVRLAVYDALGREVAVLVDAEVEAGRRAATLDGSRLPAGVYLARLTTGTGFAQTQPLTLVR